MNINEQENIRSPSGNDDICAKFTIDTVDEAFVLHDIAEVGQEYTLSFWCYSETGGEITAGNVDMPTSSSWARYVVTFMSDSVHVPIYFNIVGTYHVYNAQLEIGCKATDFALNPADTEEDVAALAVVVNSHSTQFTVMDGKIAGLIEENVTIRGEYDTLVDRTADLELSLDAFSVELESTKTIVADNYISLQEYTDTQITAKAEEINLSVASTYSTKEELETVDGKVTTLEDWQSEASQKITKDGIIATVGNYYAYQSDLDTVENRVTEAESQILQQADEISLRVNKDGIINAINLSTEEVKIAAARITLAGATIADSFTATNLHVTGNSVFDGKLNGATGSFSGSVTTSNIVATGGTIGGWSILSTRIRTSSTIYMGAKEAGMMLMNESTAPYIYAQDANGSPTFQVTRNGSVSLTGSVTAQSLTAYDSISMRSSDGVINKVIGYSSSGQFWLGGTPSGATTQLTTIYGPVTIYGDATHSVLTCGKIQTEDIDITRDYSGGWINALQGHAAINISQAGGSSGFNALARVMTTNGAWTIGTLNSNNGFYIAYGNATRLANGVNGTDSDFAVLANGDVYVRGMIEFKDWNGTKRSPISSASTDSNRVSYIASKKNDNGTYYITVQGQFGTTGSTYVAKNISTNTSDVRLKCNIVDTKVAALPVINQMAIRAFDWWESGIHRSIGFVADELEAIDPALAFGGGYDEYGDMIEKNVDVFYLAGYLTKGIQELYSVQVEHTDRILTLEARLDEQMLINEYLMDENAKLKKRVAQLEEQQAA